MTPAELARAIARCDEELERIAREGATGDQPAWLIAMAVFDWEAEKRAIEEAYTLNNNGSEGAEHLRPDCSTGSAESGESKTLDVPSGLAAGAETAQGPALAPGQTLEEFCQAYQKANW